MAKGKALPRRIPRRRLGHPPRCRRARLPAPRATRRPGRRGHAAPERM